MYVVFMNRASNLSKGTQNRVNLAQLNLDHFHVFESSYSKRDAADL